VIRGITISAHGWRGFGRDQQEDLFVWRCRFGVLTVSLDKADLFAAYRKLRASIVARVGKDNESNRGE
jgi:hypothetical protein